MSGKDEFPYLKGQFAMLALREANNPARASGWFGEENSLDCAYGTEGFLISAAAMSATRGTNAGLIPARAGETASDQPFPDAQPRPAMATLISVSPKASTWAVSSEILEHDLVFDRGPEAEAAARALAERYARAGRSAEVKIYLRGGALAGRFLHEAYARGPASMAFA